MNYRHVYHAGNFADVFKHVVLSHLLMSLHRKESPFFYLDTHAGSGRYDLRSTAAQQTGEYREGIQRLWPFDGTAGLSDYMKAVQSLNTSGALHFYPGSPWLARFFLRPQDRAMLLELHPDECLALKHQFSADQLVTVLEQDGYLGLKAHLPPKERRGLVFIDPPYEAADEFEKAVDGLRMAHARWSTGLYALWYPIKNRLDVSRFHRVLVASGIRKILLAEFSPFREDTVFRLNGCGMIVINPPWKLDETLQTLLPVLQKKLQQNFVGKTELRWLVPE